MTQSQPEELASALARAIEDRTATVGVVGLGYVGLPLASAFVDATFPVIGFDIDAKKVSAFDKAEPYLRHLGADLMTKFRDAAHFHATSEFARLAEVDVVVVCVPTPIGRHNEPDLSFVHSTAESIGQYLRPGQLVILESTTYPGTTRDQFAPRIEESSGLTAGLDFFVAYSPEREDPGSGRETTRIPKLVGGLDERSTQLACSLYEKAIAEIVRVSSAEVAESAKILENVFRAVNIAMVNELKVILTAMDIDVWEVIEAASTKPFGFMPFFPGPGLGGHCIPIDPFYLAWKAKEVDHPTRFIELAGEINRAMPDYVIRRLTLALNGQGKALRGARVLVLGVAYKKDVDDDRESPSFRIITKLADLGCQVDYSDPHVPFTRTTREYDLEMKSVDIREDTLTEFDAIVICTDHSAFDYELIARHSRLIVDTRGAMRPYAHDLGDRLVSG